MNEEAPTRNFQLDLSILEHVTSEMCLCVHWKCRYTAKKGDAECHNLKVDDISCVIEKSQLPKFAKVLTKVTTRCILDESPSRADHHNPELMMFATRQIYESQQYTERDITLVASWTLPSPNP